jgi:hypothetical protein
MSYLNNSTITVDAILTKKGRELLAQGRSAFNITKFALADDEIDYDLWNPSHPGGTDYYGSTIENLPILQAVPDETQSLKYKLITLPPGTTHVPYIKPSSTGLSLGSIDLTTNQGTTGIDVRPETVHLNAAGVQQADPNLSYSYQILDNTYATFSDELSKLPGRSVSKSGIGASTGVTIVPTGTQLPAGTTATTKLIITGDQTGARLVIPVTVTQRTV